jgi:hypothetical protein
MVLFSGKIDKKGKHSRMRGSAFDPYSNTHESIAFEPLWAVAFVLVVLKGCCCFFMLVKIWKRIIET